MVAKNGRWMQAAEEPTDLKLESTSVKADTRQENNHSRREASKQIILLHRRFQGSRKLNE